MPLYASHVWIDGSGYHYECASQRDASRYSDNFQANEAYKQKYPTMATDTPQTDTAAFSVPDPAQFHPGEPIEVVLASKAREIEQEVATLRKHGDLMADALDAAANEAGCEYNSFAADYRAARGTT